MKRFVLLLVASLALCVGQANAQRCLPKMRGIELRGGMADGFYSHSNRADAGYCFGAALATYTKGGDKWVFGGEYLQRYNPYKERRIPTVQFTAEGGFYYNFLSDARKIFFVYIGGSALAGYETVNWGDKVLFDGSRLASRDAFIYGGAISLEVEAYLADRIALTMNVRERCLWGGSTGHFRTQFGVGVKFIID
ncbi:MAG: conjugal transfer protein TraO [Paraprevotella clara]|uniref:Conjugative transposon protein TraO n=1 Tax=Paraprevotella clara TaxID=454154 RepID=A0A6N2YD30_9BACT|nr:conjugal transfer protein TraO [Rikenella microfusus]